MSADSDLNCSPVPTAAPEVSEERSRPTEAMNRVDGGWSMTKKVIVGLLVVALLAGVAFAIVKDRLSGGAASASEAVTQTEGSAKTVATATGTAAVPTECQGDVTDPQKKWYCEDFLPFATKAAADHDRLDRLEAQLKDAKDSKDTGSSGVPMALWVVVIFIGILSVYNTVQIVSTKTPPPAPPGTNNGP